MIFVYIDGEAGRQESSRSEILSISNNSISALAIWQWKLKIQGMMTTHLTGEQ